MGYGQWIPMDTHPLLGYQPWVEFMVIQRIHINLYNCTTNAMFVQIIFDGLKNGWCVWSLYMIM